MGTPIGRFAPSPTGDLHFGSLAAALASWLCARAAGGRWLVRIEDIDPAREQPGASARILADLAACGLHGDGEVAWQSTRHALYRTALERLAADGMAFRCGCSRRQLAPSGIHRGPCLLPTGASRWAWRLAVPDACIEWHDGAQGRQREVLREQAGDFVLWRVEDLPAYQLAVVVDDGLQGITEVVRGADLLDSTARQICLQQALGLPTPAYLHIPLAVDASGNKLSKQNLAPPLRAQPPLAALAAAFRFLGQDAGGLDASTVESWLQQALRAFRRERIPGRRECRV